MEIKVLKDILSANDQIAQKNRALLENKQVFTINIMSSPGAGKTSLILETIRKLKNKVSMGVIEGDISSTIDAEKVKREKVPVLQINTGGECHLEAVMVNRALDNLPLDDIGLLFIENVGNLVCPGEFKLGEDRKVLILSVPEGDDKIYKYPLLFHLADAVVINKIDLLPYTKFDLEGFSLALKGINQKARLFQVSCTTHEGIEDWTDWVLSSMQRRKRTSRKKS
ncbi:MAG: hydrogenase accessory protein HypB [Chloroflexi bacterium RBG_13_53_26]|nr:MAG: hydrogenase accessory protein HypB [Chloroflexi bacterium RBG_13_53_26]